jgi:hypothetical protein
MSCLKNAVEPNSARAEELRRLLDVVAGLTPDELGRISEPIVKDELAIVEFLTQRANDPSTNTDISNSAPENSDRRYWSGETLRLRGNRMKSPPSGSSMPATIPPGRL